MRWCCGGGSGTSSANINNNCQQKSDNNSISGFGEALTPTTMMTELSFKSGKNFTKLSKAKNGKDGNKIKSNNSGNEKHCVLQQHQNDQNVQLSELECTENSYSSTVANETATRGVLKSSLKLLRNKSGDQRAKGVQYADEVRLHGDTVSEEREDADRDERVRLLQNEENENVAQILPKKGGEIELGGASRKHQFLNDIPFQQDIDNTQQQQSPTNQSHFSNSSLPMFKQNTPNLLPYHRQFQQFDKYGPMLVRTCKTVSKA